MEYSTLLFQAVNNLTPGAEFGFTGNNIESIEWFSQDIPQPTEAEIQAEVQRLQAEYDANQYQRDRAVEYPSIEDQLDDIFHNGVEGWKATIQAVKDKYPKGV